MRIEPLSLTVRQLCDGYADYAEDGVVAFGGKLDIRPKYQREFIYSEKQQQAVINTAMRGVPAWRQVHDGFADSSRLS